MILERVAGMGAGSRLSGIVSEPVTSATGAERRSAFVLLNAGIVHRVGPSRLHVTLARAVAAAGTLALRFDLSGIGDSATRAAGLSWREGSRADLRDALDWLQKTRGIEQFLLFGICSGADLACQAAIADSRVTGLVLIDGYAYRTRQYHIEHYRRRLLRPSSWRGAARRGLGALGLSPEDRSATGRRGASTFFTGFPPMSEIDAALHALALRGVRQLHLYTGGYEPLYNHAGQFNEMFPSVADAPGVAAEFWPGAGHTFQELPEQARLTGRVVQWLGHGR